MELPVGVASSKDSAIETHRNLGHERVGDRVFLELPAVGIPPTDDAVAAGAGELPLGTERQAKDAPWQLAIDARFTSRPMGIGFRNGRPAVRRVPPHD